MMERVTTYCPTQAASPQPAPGQGDGSYELKFLLAEEIVAPVIAWARGHIPPDPHAEEAGGDSYEIHSLYFDTSELDVFHRSPGFRQTKYRVRRYGQEPLLYLERKSKRRGWVQKQRTPIPEAELARLREPADGSWAGDWFRERLEARALVPQCQVAYRRLARVGVAEGAPIRLTLDRGIRCTRATTIELARPAEAQGQLIQRTILELKFRNGLPRLYKELIREFGLSRAPESKYRRAVSLCGLVEREG